MNLDQFLKNAARKHLAEHARQLNDDTFGPNPCNRTVVVDTQTGTGFTTLCDSPRCEHCGPRKAKLLWDGITGTFGAQANLYTVTDDLEYRRLRDRIRKHRQTHGVPAQYVSWHIGNGTRLLLTDVDLTGGQRVMLAKIKKGLLEAYQQGRAALRKTWDIASVTLFHKRQRKSVNPGESRFVVGRSDASGRSADWQLLADQASKHRWKVPDTGASGAETGSRSPGTGLPDPYALTAR